VGSGARELSEADAADVVQTTWLRLVEHLDRIGDPSRLGSWLATTARRECLGVNRRAARCIPRGEELPDLPVDAPRPSERLISEHNAVAVRAALERLGPRDRALLRMLTVEPTPSHEEISVALDLAVGSIGPKRARALTRLSEPWEPDRRLWRARARSRRFLEREPGPPADAVP
jgi:RNA polymerase sigma factor (sigma-70 family)